LFICLFVCAGCRGQTDADLVLVHGRLFATTPGAHAVAIRRDRIVAIGTDESVLKLAGSVTVVYDLAGHTVFPGFNDAHTHWEPRPIGIDLKLSGMDPSWSEVLSAIKATAEKSPKGVWIYATTGAKVATNPTASRRNLDHVAPDNPVWVGCWSGHGLVVNTAALQKLGLSEEEPDTDELHYERFPGTKQLSGRFTEYEQWVQNRRLASLATKKEKMKSLHDMGNEAVRFGVTSMQIMPTTTIDEFQAELREASLQIRVRAIDFTLPGTSSWTADPVRNGAKDFSSNVRVSGLKWILDGTPVERGAALRTSYADKPDWNGKLDLRPDKLKSVVQRAWSSGDQTLFHVVSDRATAELFKAMEDTGPDNAWRAKRMRIEHGEGIVADLLPRAVKLGVVVVQNPSHFNIRDVTVARYGATAKVQPLRSLMVAGVPIAIGSDGPSNPYLNITFATVHPDNPDEAITRVQAIEAYTRGAAFAEFAERQKGSLVEGQLADVVVPSDDILVIPNDALPGVHSVLTLVGGRVVSDDGTLEHAGSEAFRRP
jgi:predicted amidohydrolase YtcJ